MRIISFFACLLGLFLVGCGGGSNEVIFEKGEPGTATGGSTRLAPGEPHLVHIDTIERIATVRNGENLDAFLIATDRSGNQSGVLKALPLRSGSSLRTADILEGKPRISDRVRQASASEADELAKIYRDVDGEIE